MRKRGVLCLVAGLIVAIGAAGAQAGLAIDFTDPTVDFTNNNWSLGWTFTVDEPVTVTALGFYDDQKNGLTETHDVAIYDDAQQIVVSGQVTQNDPLVSWWRWTNVEPTVLDPGTEYKIVSVTGSENYTWDPSGFVVDPRVNFLLDAYYTPANGALTYPNATDQVVGYFGPNFMLDSVVPVPGSLLLLVPGLMGVVGLRRRLS